MTKHLSSRLHDVAKGRALKDLRELHPGEYRVLFDGYLDELRTAHGWVDERPAANARRQQGEHPQERDSQGRFV